MLPHRVPVTAPEGSCTPRLRQVSYCALFFLLATAVLRLVHFLYGKCDTREHMSTLLTKTARILKQNDIEYWLDKGTLLGVHRDKGLIPWEYDVDMGVMNATCAKISALKSEFKAVGLTAYDREDAIPHKVKLTYDTENHEFYWSDPKLHDPCIRVYDTADVGTWVDIYWYVELTRDEVAAARDRVLLPPDYDDKDSLICCSEGLQAYTTHMCCGGCVPRKSLFPLQRQFVNVYDGVNAAQKQPVPAQVAQFLSIQYGADALLRREIKVSGKGSACYRMTHFVSAAGLEARRLWLLDASIAIYSAHSSAPRCSSNPVDLFPTPMVRSPLETAQALTEELELVGNTCSSGTHVTDDTTPIQSQKNCATNTAVSESRTSRMDDEFTTVSRRFTSKRLHRKAESSPEITEPPQRSKRETNYTRELIDFDLIKGSALFHTKPSSHDRKLVQEGFTRALFLPFHRTFWQEKPWMYEKATALYLLHTLALGIYLFCRKQTSSHNAFEVVFPILLLLLVAIGYGRVSSALQAPDTDAPCKILSPLLQQTDLVDTSESDTSHAASGLGSGLAESENSDSTESDEDSNSSSSSSDEVSLRTAMFAQSSSAPASPKRMRPLGSKSSVPLLPPRVPLRSKGTVDRETFADQFARRRVTVCVWENGYPVKRAMSISELRNTILVKVKATPPRLFYRKVAEFAAIVLSVVPLALRCTIQCQEMDCLPTTQEPLEVLVWICQFLKELSTNRLLQHCQMLLSGASVISISCMLSTYYLASIVFTALADAEVTYHRRFLYAKCFTALTSSRRSRLAKLPHFRLKNVVNIKAWISLRGGRTWLKRQGRQRAADEIVSTSFLIILVLLVVMGMQAVSDGSPSLSPESIVHIEVAMWCMLSTVFMLRFMMLGSNINRKYQNTSLLLTEQMNVYLRLLAKPHKKDKLLVSNNVLKLACKLLKELNSPNKVSGLTMNPLLYNITRVVVLSAFSSTASDFFGFKLKLWKLKA
ncbi:hypothetical protein CCR75_001978 [Bremia lactucae]|uniref:PHTF1/2 N-terminal domain-containing protein n=1 Tax=Bremia lactucae TaxID=4779 RepID=A0A976IME5_BRELC|nr:hypothetical protein CCR75_001978 [Bremia lactucae]